MYDGIIMDLTVRIYLRMGGGLLLNAKMVNMTKIAAVCLVVRTQYWPSLMTNVICM